MNIPASSKVDDACSEHVFQERMSTDHARFSTLMTARMTQLIEDSGIGYPRMTRINLKMAAARVVELADMFMKNVRMLRGHETNHNGLGHPQCSTLERSMNDYIEVQCIVKMPHVHVNEQLHVFDSEDTLEDAEQSRLKMNKFQTDEKVQALKIKPIDYRKLNKLYDNFVPQKELSAEQTYFSSSYTSSEDISSGTKLSMASMRSANPILVDLN
nr:hypothetical protein [Tanacetum cinerariifolium]